ncbi:MAG: CotH kinase family protein, partial [Clostridia bacterium]|nr:CotH kinase family protein [Clostridia bacterium]
MKKLIKLLAILCCAVMMFTVMGGCFNPSNSSSGDGSSSGSSAETPASSDTPASSEEPEEPEVVDPMDTWDTMPVVRISTPTDTRNNWATQYNRNDKLQDRIDYIDGTVTVDSCPEVYKMENVVAEVKVRGNYTLEYAKKPIRIKFDKAQNMLGLHKQEKYKNWVLLADWKDLSALNNTMAFYLGQEILGSDGYYCTDFQNVEVYLNGQYWGVYLLVEQQEVKEGKNGVSNRMSVPEVPTYENEDGDELGYAEYDVGYVMEYDG